MSGRTWSCGQRCGLRRARATLLLAMGAIGQGQPGSAEPSASRSTTGTERIMLVDAVKPRPAGCSMTGEPDRRLRLPNRAARNSDCLGVEPRAQLPAMVPTVYLLNLRDPARYFMHHASRSNEDVLFISNAPATDLRQVPRPHPFGDQLRPVSPRDLQSTPIVRNARSQVSIARLAAPLTVRDSRRMETPAQRRDLPRGLLGDGAVRDVQRGQLCRVHGAGAHPVAAGLGVSCACHPRRQCRAHRLYRRD